MRLKLLALAILLLVIAIPVAMVAAQDVPPVEPPDAVDSFLDQFGAFLTLHVAVLSGALVIAIDQIKALILVPLTATLKISKDTPQYKWVFLFARFVLSVYAYFNLWGGVDATLGYVPSWSSLHPSAVAAIAILFVVGFEEFGHLAMEWLQVAVKVKKSLKPVAA